MSGAGYTIYANGYNDFVNNCELSEWEVLATPIKPTSSSNYFEFAYDGFIGLDINTAYYIKLFVSSDGGNSYQYIGAVGGGGMPGGNLCGASLVYGQKGDRIYYLGYQDDTTYCPDIIATRYYKKRDYSNR